MKKTCARNRPEMLARNVEISAFRTSTRIRGNRLQTLELMDLERLYAEKAKAGLAPATLAKIHNVIYGPFEAAVRAPLLHNAAKPSS